MATVGDLFSLEPFVLGRVVAGETGLDRQITWLQVLENPETVLRLKPGELLLTTFYQVNDNPRLQQKLLEDLAAVGGAGLILKVGRFVEKTPDAVIQKANEVGLPVIEIPASVEFNGVMRAIFTLVIGESTAVDVDQPASVLVALLNVAVPRQQRLSYTKALGINGQTPFTFLAIQPTGEGDTPAGVTQMIQGVIKDDPEIARAVCAYRGALLAVLIEGNEGDALRLADRLAATLEKGTMIGVGKRFTNASQFTSAWEQASHSAIVGAQVGSQSLWTYNDLRVHKLLAQLKEHVDGGGLLDEVFKDFIYYDSERSSNLVQTLKVYFDSTGSTKQAAAKLFVHENTVRWRLNKFSQLTGLNLERRRDYFLTELFLLLQETT